MKKILFLALLFIPTIAYSQSECPVDRVCLTREQAQVALENADKVKTLEAYIKTLETALNDQKAETAKMRLEYAETRGELTALKQNAVSDRAIIEILLKSTKKKCFPLSICF